MNSNKKPPEIVDGSSNSKGVRKVPNQPSERTSEASGSVVPEYLINDQPTLSSPGTTNSTHSEQRNWNNLKQALPHDVNNQASQPSLRSGTVSFVNANTTSAGGMSAKDVSILPNAVVPLRDILEGGMNLGDSHLNNHGTLPKRKQKRPRIPAEQDVLFTPPQNSAKTTVGALTLGDTNQYSVPKTTPRILRENPELEYLHIMDTYITNSCGGSSIPLVSEIRDQGSSSRATRKEVVDERGPLESPTNNTLSNNAQGNFVEGLPGRVSFLSKQNTSSKGALEGGSSALTVSKRPKQTGVPRRSLANDTSPNVSSHVVQKTVPKEMQINHSELFFANESTQSYPKYNTKETKRLDLPDPKLIDLIPVIQKRSAKIPEDPITGLPGNNSLHVTQAQPLTPRKLSQSEQKSGLAITSLASTEQIISKVSNNLNAQVSTSEKPERNITQQSCQNSKDNVTVNNRDATTIKNRTLEGESTHSTSDQKLLNYKNNFHREGLAAPKRSAQKGANQSEKDRDSKNITSNQKDKVSPKVSKAPNHQTNPALQQNNINQSSKPPQDNRTSNPSDVVNTKNKDGPKNCSGSPVPKVTGQKESASKKNRKLKEEMDNSVLTPPASGLGNHDALPKEVAGGHKAKRSATPLKSDGERNLGYTETVVPHVPKKESLPKKTLGKGKQEATSSKKDESLGVTISSSIIDLPVPNNMNN